MMNQSEAEKQITKILAQLEQDQGVVVESVSIHSHDASSICRTVRKKIAVIEVSTRAEWSIE